MIRCCFRIPNKNEEGKWMLCKEVFDTIQKHYPVLQADHSTKIKIGQVLKYMGCCSQHSMYGRKYQLIERKAA